MTGGGVIRVRGHSVMRCDRDEGFGKAPGGKGLACLPLSANGRRHPHGRLPIGRREVRDVDLFDLTQDGLLAGVADVRHCLRTHCETPRLTWWIVSTMQ